MTQPERTYCEACDNVAELTRNDHPRYWQCTQHPRLNEGFGYVSFSAWDKMPPYLYCRDVNGGQCPLFTPRRKSEDQ